jgi:phage terminase small subunit
MTLTDKQEQFCQEYLVDLNATKSAKRAGFSARSAKSLATALMAKPHIKERIADLMKNRAERLRITQDLVISGLAGIVKEDIRNFISFKPNKIIVTDPQTGEKTEKEIGAMVSYKDSDAIDTSNIAELSIGRNGQLKIKLYPKDNALVHLGRHLGMFLPKLDNHKDNHGTTTPPGPKYSDIIQPIEIITPDEYQNYQD